MRARCPWPPTLLAILVLAPLALAASYPDPQRAPHDFDSPCTGTFDKRFVFDYLILLPDTYGREVEGAACEVYQKTSAHFVLLLVSDTGGESLENYAFHLFERWGVGDRQRLDGLLLLYVANLSGGGPAVRVEVGYGLEGVVNSRVSAQALAVMRQAKGDALAAGEPASTATVYALGTGSSYLLQTLDDHYVDGAFPQPATRSPDGWFWLLALLFFVLVVAALARAANRPGGWGYGTSPHWAGGPWGGLMGPSGNFGRGSDGFGGHSRGGGGFGGGRSGGGGGGGRL